MEKLIGFNLVAAVVWFFILLVAVAKTDQYEHFGFFYIVFVLMTAIFSIGIYYLAK